MSQTQIEILENTFIGVLEEMAFMFADPVSDPNDLDWDNEFLITKMTFSGPVKGTISLTLPKDMTSEIAENILGLDPDELPENAGGDALKELLNVTCGQFLTNNYGEEPVFDLGVPSVEKQENASKKFQELIEPVLIDVDGYPVYLTIS